MHPTGTQEREMDIDIKKKYTTRDGRVVSDLTHAGRDCYYPIHGKMGGTLCSWTREGEEFTGDAVSDNDLILLQEPEQKVFSTIHPYVAVVRPGRVELDSTQYSIEQVQEIISALVDAVEHSQLWSDYNE